MVNMASVFVYLNLFLPERMQNVFDFDRMRTVFRSETRKDFRPEGVLTTVQPVSWSSDSGSRVYLYLCKYNAITQIVIAGASTRQKYRHSMMTSWQGNSSTLLVLCEGNPSAIEGFPSQRVSNAKFVLFFCFLMIAWTSCQTTFGWPVIWDAMTPMWRHCNGADLVNKIWITSTN